MDNKILLERNGIKFIKVTANKFNVTFVLENSLDVRPLINLNLLKLIHDLNPDLFESFSVINSGENTQQIYMLFKDLFAELGIPQYYYHFSFTIKHSDPSLIKFIITPIDGEEKNNAAALCVPLTSCELTCVLQNNIVGLFNIDVEINNTDLFNSAFFEKMVGMILYKVINRLKQFISTII